MPDTLAWAGNKGFSGRFDVRSLVVLSLADRFLVMRMIFGGHVDKTDYHLVGLNEEFLNDLLRVAGFVGMRKVDGFGLFDDSSSLTLKDVPISLNMVCTKPA